MSGAVQLRFDYDALDAPTRAFVRDRAEMIHTLARTTATAIVHIGQTLKEVKNRLGHGKFLEWIGGEFAWKERTAHNFMSVHERFKSAKFADLQIDVSALYLIAAPKTPEPVVNEVMRRAAAGEVVTHESVKVVVNEYKKTGNLPEATKALTEIIVIAKKQEAAAGPPLPKPAEARRLAIESGKHTLDRNGDYQPPMSVEDQEKWKADLHRVNRVREFLEADHGDPEEFAGVISRRYWAKEFPASNIDAAIGWLERFREALWHENEKKATTLNRKHGDASKPS